MALHRKTISQLRYLPCEITHCYIMPPVIGERDML